MTEQCQSSSSPKTRDTPDQVRVDDAINCPFRGGTWWPWSAGRRHQSPEAIRQAAAGGVVCHDEPVRVAGGWLVTFDFSIAPPAEAGVVGALVPSAVDVPERPDGEGRARALTALIHRLAGVTSVRDVMTTVAGFGPDVLQAIRCRVALWDPGRNVPVATAPANDCTAAAPLHNARGEVFAVLDIDWPCDVIVSPALIMDLRAMVDICGRVLQRAMAHDAQESLVRALRHELLPTLPAVTGLELAACSLPASDQLAFGGDWHDVIRLGPSRTAVVVGDMVGHGVRAAARMARVRGLLNALIQLDPYPGAVFSRAFDLLMSLRDPFIGTAAVFVIDTAADVVVFARAGHPPALLRTPNGDVVLLTGGHGPALGLPTRDVAPGRLPFAVGSTLLAYTDGLIERRGEDLDTGIRRIIDQLHSSHSGSSPTAAQVLHRVLRGAGVTAHRRDDVAAVVIRRT